MKTKQTILIIIIIIGAYLAYKYLVVGPEISQKRTFSREDFHEKFRDWKFDKDLNNNIQNKDFESLQMASLNNHAKDGTIINGNTSYNDSAFAYWKAKLFEKR